MKWCPGALPPPGFQKSLRKHAGPDMKRGTESETQTQIEQEAGIIETAVAVAPEPGTRPRRGAEVRRKYDFAVIRTLRHQKGLTIEKFAKLCGLSYAPISRIETNLIK